MNERPESVRFIEAPTKADVCLASADITVSDNYKKLPDNKAKKVAKTVLQKAALTASALFILYESGITGVVRSQVNSIEPPKNLSAPISIATPAPEAGNIEIGISDTDTDFKSAEITNSSERAKLAKEYKNLEYKELRDVYLRINVAFDKDNSEIPVKYKIPADFPTEGEEVFLDKNTVKNIRDKAVSSGEPQIFAILPRELQTPWVYYSDNSTENPKHKLEHPVLSNLPEDVLSEQELAANGVKIIQSDKTNLYIRKQAFDEGGPLAELAKGHGSEKLTIVLIDSPFVDREFMKDKKYDGLRELVPAELDVNSYRVEKINELKTDLKAYTEYLRNGATDKTQIEAYISDLRKKLIDAGNDSATVEEQTKYQVSEYVLEAKYEILAYENKIITDDWIKANELPNAVGRYIQGEATEGKYLNRTIFVAVGWDKYNLLISDIIYFTPDGKVAVRGMTSRDLLGNNGLGFSAIYHIKKSQSCPDPGAYLANANVFPKPQNPSVGGPPWPGRAVNHEIRHDIDIGQAINEGKEPDYNEYNTDLEAMRDTGKASDKWKNSGFTDNSGYPLVFSLPPEQGGGFILN
jgi:hypothetical protein